MGTRFRSLSLIKKIVLFQLTFVVVACAVYAFVAYRFHSKVEQQIVEIRRNDVRNSLAPLYDDLVSSRILGLDEHYGDLKKQLMKNKKLVGLEVLSAEDNERADKQSIHEYDFNVPGMGHSYLISVNDGRMIGTLVDANRAENLRMVIIWSALFAVLIVMSILIYTIQIGRPVRGLVRILKGESPTGELDVIRRRVGGEIGLIAGEVKRMLFRTQETERMRGELEREKEINLIRQRIAHDVRSPLSVIKAYIETAPKPDDDPEWDEFYESAQRSINKLQKMTRNLMDYSRAKQIDRDKVLVRTLVGDALSEVKLKARECGVTIGQGDGENFAVNLDRHKLNRVLVNIVTNAMQACEGEGSVSVDAVCESTDLLIRVRDDGKGIDPEYLYKIFEGFFTKDKMGGTGLGLAYCKQVVEAHGGDIDVASVVGKGTTFTVRIPKCVVDMGDVSPQ